MNALVCRLAGLLIATAAAVASPAHLPPAQASVIGKDDRTEVPPEYRRLADGVADRSPVVESGSCT